MSLSTGQALKKAREVRGISASDAARSAGISAAYLNRLENDTVKRPSPLVLDQLSGVLAVPYVELIAVERLSRAGPNRSNGQSCTRRRAVFADLNDESATS